MSNNKMLIDATHPEETRVVVLRSGRVEEFDYESAARKLLRGNIYLAKVTRVEPSLQAAFVEYGGNRHGFLAFNEIHPDYYQIPMADRQALLDEEAAAEAREEAEVDAHAERLARRQSQRHDRPRRVHAQRPGQGAQPTIDEARSAAAADDEVDAGPRTLAEAVEGAADVLREDPPPGDENPAATDVETEAAEASGSDAAPVAEHGGDEDDEDAEDVDDIDDGDDEDADDEDDEDEAVEASDEAGDDEAVAEGERGADGNGEAGDGGNVEIVAPVTKSEVETVEQVGAEDALEELQARTRRRPRSYKIQEVIKRRQVILVQVVKEERGNKGAALTTYLSLAGRYTVLMPNTARGGGISRKITQPQDRKRLKAIAQELEVPEGMGLIIRTAGAARTKQEIKRDFEYLLRLWESVREMTLQSTAPSLVYEEGNLIKRSIRDLYNKDVDEIVVAGEEAHRDARDFMRMLMPSHAKNVIQHSDPEPLFTRFGIERQLNAMFSPYVTLRSGGYLVINQTEALVAIDVNSGKSTREFSIEETALNTNLEAADEIARQLKLRDLAGLVVIDFIDMEEKRNNRAVERRLKDALRFDRARIQLGRISHFGLMEMSRQRMRTGVLEGSTSQCPHCQGTGIIRSTESVALAVLRGIEDALMAGARTSLIATTTSTVALYLLNNKRPYINEMEARHSISIAVQASEKLQGANFTIEKGHSAAPAPSRRADRPAAVNMDWGFDGEEQADEEPIEEVEEADGRPEPRRNGGGMHQARENGDGGRDGGRRRRRRRGRRGDRNEGDDSDRSQQFERQEADGREDDDIAPSPEDGAGSEADANDEAGDRSTHAAPEGSGEREGGRRRRRGRRGGRRGRDRGERSRAEFDGDTPEDLNGAEQIETLGSEPIEAADTDDTVAPPSMPRGRGSRSSRRGADHEAPAALAARDDEPGREPEARSELVAARADEAAVEADADKQQEIAKPRRSTASSEPKLERVVVGPDAVAEESSESEAAIAAATRRGWWQRR